MASFAYEAVNAAGKPVKGSVEADSADKVRSDLKSKGLVVLSVTEQNALNKDINIDIGGAPKARDMSVFCRQFVSMNRAGVSILDSLNMLADSTENKKLKEAIKGVRIETEKGESMSNAMKLYPKVFSELMINMVAAGESAGKLDVSFERMAKQFERSSKTQSLVKKAMMYPIMLCIVAVIVVIIMLVKVIPSYAEMFADMGTDLPGITKAMMILSEFIMNKWYLIIAVVIAVVVGISMFKKTLMGKHFFGKLVLMLPAIKTFSTKNAAAMMARTLSTLLGAGVPLVEAVGMTAKTMSNIWFKEALEDAQNSIMIGMPLSRPLEECGLYPPMVYYMARIGEETGNNEEMLDKLADYYEEEVEAAVGTLMAAMEPMIIVVMAGIVGILIAACMAPMLKMYQELGNL